METMFANKNYKRDINYVFELSRFVFRLLGIWPYARTKTWFPETIERLVVILVSYILLTCELVPAILYMAIVQKETRARLKVVATVIFTMVAMAKYGQLVFSRDRVRSCLAQVEDDWRNVADSRNRDVMTEKAKTGRRLLVICAIFMYSTGVSFRTIIPLSRGKIVTEQNITIRHLPCPNYFVLFDVQLSPAYEIVFLMQFFSGVVKCTVTTAVCGLAGLCVMHVCAQLEILMVLMNNLVNERELKNVNERLAIIVKHQIKARNFLQLVQNTIQYTSLLEVIGCTIIVCLLGYFVIMEWEDNNSIALCSYLIGLTSISFNIFIFCFIGEQLSTKGEKVALTACTLEWYRLPDAKARSLILIMIMSNLPTKIRGGKFMDLSLRTFGNVVRTAVAYLNLLRSVVG
ncbi:odorant receptor 56a [Solenopsis invicta]|uniref:odorant receptor 56a n=1 Tax=Solenopsis invicta TaxID=13686 RepID=UPI000595AFDB|nr:odorant receptor 56a [Solenopsis invicta]